MENNIMNKEIKEEIIKQHLMDNGLNIKAFDFQDEKMVDAVSQLLFYSYLEDFKQNIHQRKNESLNIVHFVIPGSNGRLATNGSIKKKRIITNLLEAFIISKGNPKEAIRNIIISISSDLINEICIIDNHDERCVILRIAALSKNKNTIPVKINDVLNYYMDFDQSHYCPFCDVFDCSFINKENHKICSMTKNEILLDTLTRLENNKVITVKNEEKVVFLK